MVELALQLISALNQIKYWGGMFMLGSSVGMALIEPLLAALPTSLQCVRVGPLAATTTYSARDFAITNIIMVCFSEVPLWFFFKQNFMCGWNASPPPPPPAAPSPPYPPPMPPVPPMLPQPMLHARDSEYSVPQNCDTMPQTYFEYEEKNLAVLGFLLVPIAVILCMAYKLPKWEPPIVTDETSAEPRQQV